MGSQRLRINFDVVLDGLAPCTKFFDWVFGVGGSVACRCPCIGKTMRVRIETGRRWTGDTDTGRHDGGRNWRRGVLTPWETALMTLRYLMQCLRTGAC